MSNPLSIFERAKAPHKKKKPFVHKPKRKEELITVHKQKVCSAPDEKLISVPDAGKPSTTPDFESLDKLLGPALAPELPSNQRLSGEVSSTKSLPETSETQDSTQLASSQTSPKMSSLPGLLVAGEMDKIPEEIVRKYEGHQFPIPTSKATLKEKTSRYLDIIPKLLAGEEDSSIFYTYAHAQKEKSPNATMSSQERWDIPWAQFIGGFYGLKRQSFISTLILAKFAGTLKKSKNKTIAFWSPDMFCTYVLANEIILRIVMADMGLTKLQAESKLRETADFGSYLADQVVLHDDLDFSEFEIFSPGSASEVARG